MKTKIGDQYGRLTVIEKSSKRINGSVCWVVQCSCKDKTVKTVNGADLRKKKGGTRSCGCLAKEWGIKHGKSFKTHGRSKTPEYLAWQDIKARCNNSNHKHYKHYGGRGIKVCDRWLESFENFFEDMGRKPDPKYSIDRINNDGDYEPSNCRWASFLTQCRNRRNNKFYTYEGKTMCVQDWAEEVGISGITLRTRLSRGWSFEKAITTPVQKKISRSND